MLHFVIRMDLVLWKISIIFLTGFQRCNTVSSNETIMSTETYSTSSATVFKHFVGNNVTTKPNILTTNSSNCNGYHVNKKSTNTGTNRSKIQLTFGENDTETIFMMVKSNAFIQLDGEAIPTFQLRLCREISFQFRTRLPHGLLVYHSVKSRPEGSPPYALYIIVEKGQLKVVHVFDKYSTSLTVGKGLNRDRWHNVIVRIDVHGARLLAKVDNISAEINLQGLHVSSNYGISTDLTSVVLIGGLSPEEKLHGVKYIIESFVGCIKDIVLSSGKAASALLPIDPLVATKHENVQEGCINKCHSKQNTCFFGSKCINHYSQLTCDCFGTLYEGEFCDFYTATILTVRGSSYVSYRVYDWKDRVHSFSNRISIHFKTRFDDSVLFYASGEHHKHHYIAASIWNNSLVLEFDLGDGSPVSTILKETVTNNKWYNLTIDHDNNILNVNLNNILTSLQIENSPNYLYIDPEIYIGGGPELSKKKGLRSNHNFVGSLKYVFFNEISIIYELKKGNPKVHYIGLLEPEFIEADVDVIPITFPFPSSHISWPIIEHSTNNLRLIFEFRTYRNLAVLASTAVNTSNGLGYCEVRVVNEEVRFELVSNLTVNASQLITVKYDIKNPWHSIDLIYKNGSLNITVDKKLKANHIFEPQFYFIDSISIGSGLEGNPNLGLIGCMRNITINDVFVEPRHILRTNYTIGEASIDNCQLVDPCKSPNACKHGGKCSVKDDTVICDCSGTGYIGKNCHFAQFRKTCEELALLGYTKPDVYLIDIDGNGKFPPAHVKCEFQSLEDWKTKTIVEHNLPSQVDVRSLTETDFSFNIKYREFSPEMLNELITHSLNCSQYIKYDCYKAPLELYSATWFVSAAQQGIIDYIGNVKRGSCPCSENKTCISPTLSCNCDISEGKWHSDEGYYITPPSLGIIKMVFLQQKDLAKDAFGRISLGPLECVEANTQRYVVTFTTSQSYIEVPGWRKGDIAFSFRTTGEKAILLYQPPIRQHYPSFMVVLTSDFELTFNFTLNTGDTKELEIKSQRRLNSGEWQKIWIDYNKHHVRFMINTDYQMVDLQPHEEFGPFEGSMFIGGAVENLVVKGSVYQGLVGCFRGLVVNGEILDIYSYMSVHLSEIIKECKPKCDPNPCLNGAKCKELWNRFECVCENQWAFKGVFCEENINIHGVTLISEELFLNKNYLANNNLSSNPEWIMYNSLLNSTILLNIRTYDTDSLILYANNHLNNFVQLHINNGNMLVFLFNYGNTIHNVSVEYSGLNSGKSVQLAIIRNENETILNVNEFKKSIPIGVKLLQNYSNKPWTNSQEEFLSPQRPPSSPTEYLQLNIGGYDPENLLPLGNRSRLTGFIGCIRGLKIGSYLPELVTPINGTNNTDVEGVLYGCRMKCDEQPCKNQGTCIEDFKNGDSKCHCEHTSYYGEYCALEKGADFSGDSILQRKFVLEGVVKQIKLQLAFSSSDKRQKKSALLLLQTVAKRSYYLIVALSAEGELIFEEDREGSVGTYGAHMKDRNFLNGARHSVYYKRIDNITTLMVDRELVTMSPIPYLIKFSDINTGNGAGENEVQIGGVNTSDPRFSSYKSYSGCLSNLYIEVNNNSMKPLDEYMLFTKTDSEKVNVTNSQGVRSAQCAFFDVMHKPQPSLSLNISFAVEEKWVEDPPDKIPYTSLYAEPMLKENKVTKVFFVSVTTALALFVIGAIYHIYLTNVAWRRNKEKIATAALIRSKRQSLQFQEAILANPLISVSNHKQMNHEEDTKRPCNNMDNKLILKNDYKQNHMVFALKQHEKENALNQQELKRDQKDRIKSQLHRNHFGRPDRDIIFESFEEIMEVIEESAEEFADNSSTIRQIEVKEYDAVKSDDEEIQEIEDTKCNDKNNYGENVVINIEENDTKMKQKN